MPSIKVFKQSGKESGMLELSDSVFGAEYNEYIIHQVVVAQANNARQGTKCALTRAEVSGGGIKPWRQKGTGRARQGSTRAPQWIKGGVVFAPKPRDFSQKVNAKVKEAAIKSALSKKVADGELIVVDELKFDALKTKEMAAVIANLKLSGKSVLLVLDDASQSAERAARNIDGLNVINSAFINVTDVVASTVCLATKAAVKAIEEAYND